MEVLATVLGIVLLIPLAIFLVRRLAGILALVLGAVGIFSLISQQYVGAAIFLVIAFLLTKLTPPDDPDSDYL